MRKRKNGPESKADAERHPVHERRLASYEVDFEGWLHREALRELDAVANADPEEKAVLAVFTLEAGTTDLWKRFTLLGGEAIGIDRFGASAPASALADGFGFDANTVAQRIAAVLQ